MVIPTFPPRKDSDIRTWSVHFDSKINAAPTHYGLDGAQAHAYRTLHDAFVSAYAAVINPNTNTRRAIIAKNQAREALLKGKGGAQQLVNIIQAFPSTTNAMRGQLGLRILDTMQSPVPRPTKAPQLSIVSTIGRSIKVQLHDQDHPTRRGKPTGVLGATILYHIGDEVPSNPAQWKFALNISKRAFDVDVPASVDAGSRVWLTAFWFNKRMESSAPSSPKSARISEGLAKAA